MKFTGFQINRKLQSVFLLLSILMGALVLPAQAYEHHHRYYDHADRYRYSHHGLLPGHPYVRGAAVGGGLGAAAGAIFSPEGRRGDGAIKGALLGGGAGLGYEFLRKRGLFSRF